MPTSANETRLRRLTEALPQALPDFLMAQRWFGGKARAIHATQIVDTIPLCYKQTPPAFIFVVQVEYAAAPAETYALPLKLSLLKPGNGESLEDHALPVLRLHGAAGEDDFLLSDALWDRDFALLLLDSIDRRLVFKGHYGELQAVPTRAFEWLLGRGQVGFSLEPALMKREQSNTSVIYGDRLILKFFRRLEEGMNPDVEIGTFLTERTSFAHVPAVGGSLVYCRDHQPPASMAIVQAFVHNQGDAWRYTLDELPRYFERVLGKGHEIEVPRKRLLELAQEDVPPAAQNLIGAYLDSARLLGQRTAELHLALASDVADPNFAPEPFSMSWQRIICDAMIEQAERAFLLLRDCFDQLAGPVRGQAESVLRLQRAVEARLGKVLGREIAVARIRVHGDYHLGQVLHTGGDFVIIDFEGEPARPLNERRTKRLALQDVAGMLRSFDYAAETALISLPAARTASLQTLRAWARYWQSCVSATFLKAYFSFAGRAPFLPRSREDLGILLDACLLQKATYELEYELNNRPDWAGIPLEGILAIGGRPDNRR